MITMARRQRSTETDASTTETTEVNPTDALESTEENHVTVTDETPAPTTDETPAPAAPAADTKPAETEADKAAREAAEAEAHAAFEAVVAEALSLRDDTTGTVPDGELGKVTSAYRALPGLKAKNKAKSFANDKMRDAMDATDMFLAKSYMQIGDALTAGPASGKAASEPKVPADPTEAFNLRLGALYLAAELVTANKPAELADDQGDKLEALISNNRAAASEYFAWVNREAPAEGAEDVPEPEVDPVVKAAVKAALGKSSRITKGGTSTPYTGTRRDIGKHITEAFEGVGSGEFLTVAQIRKFVSSEYTADSPASAGAISARLFPNSGACTIEGITPGQNESGNRGATKN